MAYHILRFLLRITNRFYFKTLQVKGAENIPKEGPVFFVANHPSTFMDPIVIATITNRTLFFLGKGVLFQNKLLKWLLPKFNVIPIFRSDESPDQMHKNKDVFLQCYKHLANKGAILIFPEGISLTERKIKQIKTGAARICLGAEAMYDFSLNIKIVTVGLNFSNPHKFQSDLFVSIDKPINVSDYYDLYKQDSFKAVHALTDEIRKRIETHVVAIQDADVDKLVANIELIYKAQLLRDLGHSPKIKEHDFNTTKAISDSVHYFLEVEPERVERLKNKMETYLYDLDRLALTDNVIKGLRKNRPFFNAIKSFFYLILGFPVFVYGFLNNFLPFRIPYWSAHAISKRPEFHGAIAFSIGTLTFLVFYTLQIYFLYDYIQDWRIVLTYGLSLPVSGLFAFYYFKRFMTIRANWKIFSLFYKKANLITTIISNRQTIINELEKARKDFVQHRDAQKV